MSATEPENTNSVIASATDDSTPAVDDGSLISPAASSAKKAVVEGIDATMSDDDNKVITTLETPKSTKEKIAGSHDSSGSIEIPADFILGSDIPATPAAAHATKEELEDHDLIAILEGDDVDITETATEIEVRVGGGDEGTYDGEQLLEEIHISIVDEQDLEAEKKEREREIAMRQMATLPTQPKGRKPKPMFTDGIQDVKTPTVKTSPVKRPAPKVEPVTVPAMIKAVPVQKVTTVAKPSLEIRSLPILPAKSPPGQVTIKGQTTIKPIPRPIIIKSEPTDSPSPTKKVMVPPVKPVVISKPLSQKPGSLMKPTQPTKSSSSALPPKTASTSKTLTQKSSSSTQKANPPVPRPIPIPVAKKPNDDLISSLVSDWDDEPPIVLKKEPMSPVASPPVSQQPTTANITMGPPQPPTPEEPVKRSRVIKKKIIWDPDNPETHMSFASFVKSNRTKPLPEAPPPKETFTPPPAPVRLPGTGGIRRKRAESVAVHMIKDTPQFALPPPRKRARTPEPVSSKARPPAPVAPKNTARKKKSEIEKLLGDEGAINMLYDVECENSNTDLLKTSDMKVDSDDEDEKLMAKAKIIADAVIKQGHSPNDNVTHVPRMRTKRAPTPQKQTSTSPSPVAPSTSSGPSRKSGGTTNGPGRKRKRPQSGSEDWDYVYNSRKTCDDAMIIRRRSNSSYSSSTSPRRLSVDQPNTSTTETSSVETPDKSNFEFIKPSNKSPSKLENIKLDSSLVANMKGKLSKVLASKPADISSPPTPPTKQEKKLKVSPTKAPSTESITATAATLSPTITTSTATVRVEENGAGKSWESLLERLTEMKLQELSFKRCGNYVELTLAPKETKLKDVFTVELINELKTVLNILKSDPNVKAVLIRSSGKHFCRGIDVSYLIQTNAEKRKTAAQVYSGHLRNFLQSMATFSKPLVAAIHGDMVGLGVTMLPLFDVVIAQDSSTFQTPYGILGHLPEAMKIFTSTKNLKPRAITDLLYLCRKVSVNTALDYGLVSEVVNSEKIQDRADSITKKLASLSQQVS
ncbi:uncharacterized protein LOC109430909 isoform X3 [Aedes albopictus]|uniref:Enoyl-coa hydratase/isomerase n=1 Tax=Aedes albopictus TaxID=7160 RepID=A0ABM1YEH5_AEDAL